MGRLREIKLYGATDGSGNLTVDGERSFFGRLVKVEWIVGSFAAGVDSVISFQNTPSGVAQTVLTLTDANSNATYYPRTAVHGNTGTALTATAGGDTIPPIVSGTPRLAVTSGGNAKSGGVILTIEEGE